jgi:hypothetical protein
MLVILLKECVQWLAIPVPDNSCANENVCDHVSRQDTKTHQCNPISNPVVLVRLVS